MKKYDYYKLDVGFYPDIMKICFSDDVFQEILKDHKVTLKARALDIGVAETHIIGDGQDSIIILVFNLDALNDGMDEIVGAIAHEVSHAVDHMAEYIGEENNITGETRAYFTESLARQIYKIITAEQEKNARKADRKVPRKKGNREQRIDFQMDLDGDGSAGSDSAAEQ